MILHKIPVLATILFLMQVDPLWAHAFIERAEPAVGSTIKEPPTEVSIVFTEGLEADFSHLEVFDASGKELDKKDSHLDPKNPRRLIVSLPASLAAGTYKVIWRVVSVDSHVTNGDFVFRFEP